jgi:hypothetical protein
MATYSNFGKFIDAYGGDGVISRSELDNYTGSNWEKMLKQAAKGKFRLGRKAENYVKSAQFDEQFTNNPDIGTPGYQGDLDAFIDTGAVSSLYEPGRAYASYGDLTLSVPADQANNLTIRPATINETADGSYDSTPLAGFGGISPVTVDTPPADGNEYTRDELLDLIGGSVNNTGYFGSYSGDYGVSPITSDTLYGYSSNYQTSSNTGSQSSTALGPNTGSGDMVKGTVATYDLTDPSDIALMQEFDADLYRDLVSQGQIPGVSIGDLPPLEEEEEEVYIPPTGGVDLTGGAYQPGSDSGGTGPGGSVDSGGSDSGGSGGSPGGQGGGDVTDVETPAEPYVPTDADRYYSIQAGLDHDAGLGGFNPIAYLAAYSDISDLAEDFIQEGASASGGEAAYLAAINDRGGTNFSDFSQMDPTDANFMVAREHAERFGFDEGRMNKEGTAYGEKIAEFNTGSLDNFITDLRSGKLKANTSSKTQLQTILGTFPEGQS